MVPNTEDSKGTYTKINPNYSSNETDKKIYSITQNSTGESLKNPHKRNINSMEGPGKSVRNKMITYNSEAPSEYSESGM